MYRLLIVDVLIKNLKEISKNNLFKGTLKIFRILMKPFHNKNQVKGPLVLISLQIVISLDKLLSLDRLIL
jgi:hypothetical protein